MVPNSPYEPDENKLDRSITGLTKNDTTPPDTDGAILYNTEDDKLGEKTTPLSTMEAIPLHNHQALEAQSDLSDVGASPVPVNAALTPEPLTDLSDVEASPVPVNAALTPEPLTDLSDVEASPVPVNAALTPEPLADLSDAETSPVPVNAALTPEPLTDLSDAETSPVPINEAGITVPIAPATEKDSPHEASTTLKPARKTASLQTAPLAQSATRKRGRKNRKPVSKTKRLVRWLSLILGLALLGGALGAGYRAYESYTAEYHRDLAMAQSGIQSLQSAEKLLTSLGHGSFSPQNIVQAQADFDDAQTDFHLLDQDLKTLPSQVQNIPVYGAKLKGALALIPLALEVSQAGSIACKTINLLLIAKLSNPLDTTEAGLSATDFATLTANFQTLKGIFGQVEYQVQHLPADALQVDPRVPKLIKEARTYLPQANTLINEVTTLLPILPTLLGIGTPANYLLEVLDSTELRPGGGFIGNYGILTLSNGRETGAHITDTDLLDRPFEAAGHTIAYPASYSWFDLAPGSWSLRDTDLDADFPTVARYSEQNYKLEGGNVSFQGVLAITPALIQDILTITGPIAVPEYQETVTAANLISEIHAHQLSEDSGSDTTPASDGQSSQRKHFTALLANHLLDRLHQVAGSDLPEFGKLLLNALQTKDLQIYFNSAPAENYLHQNNSDSSIQSPAGDSLFVVDANIAADKANQFITDTMTDQITLDNQGNAIHHTTLRYAWTTPGPIYGAALYQDYLRIYVPPGSTLTSVQGWQSRGTSSAFNRTVWAGFFTLTFGQTETLQLVWTVPHASTSSSGTWHYTYLLQRQAGTQWHVHLQVTLPPCSGSTTSGKGKVVSPSISSVSGDVHTSIPYTCPSS